MSKVKDIYNYLDAFAPFSSQMDWDNSGVLVNCDDNAKVEKVLVTLDVTPEVAEQAKKFGCQLIVSHHPIIFHPLTSLSTDSVEFYCAKNNISVISAHTNFDLAPRGVNFALANMLGLHDIHPVGEEPFLQIGELDTELSVDSFAEKVKKDLSASVRYNTVEHNIKKVAVCGGAGSDFFKLAKDNGADVLVTGDGKYHEFLDAKTADICLLAAGHYETESPAVRYLAQKLKKEFENIEFIVADEKSPIINI